MFGDVFLQRFTLLFLLVPFLPKAQYFLTRKLQAMSDEIVGREVADASLMQKHLGCGPDVAVAACPSSESMASAPKEEPFVRSATMSSLIMGKDVVAAPMFRASSSVEKCMLRAQPVPATNQD